MSKELEEALGLVKRTCELFIKSSSHLIGTDIIANQINEALDTIKQSLLELKQIKDTEPSDALKCVDVLKEEGCITTLVQGKILETIRQYILKAQEMERVLKIINKKEVNVNTLINCIIGAIEPLEFYNEKVSENLKLTQQEFDLLKEVLCNE